MKYKKLKTDLENKAAYVKNMEKISEKDLKEMKSSFNATNIMLDEWLGHFVSSLSEGKNIEELSSGNIAPDLKSELEEIFTFYANDFSTRFEDLTGQESRFVIGSPVNADQSSKRLSAEINVSESGIDRELLTSKVKKILVPNDWNSIN